MLVDGILMEMDRQTSICLIYMIEINEEIKPLDNLTKINK